MKKLGQGAITTGGGTLDGASIMMESFVRKVCAMSQFFGIKGSNVFTFPSNFDSSPPFIASSNHAKKTTFIGFCWALPVLKINGSRHISKIFNSVIRWVPVNVVNMVFGPFSVYVEPHKSMFPNSSAKHTNQPIPIFVQRAASAKGSLIPSPCLGKEVASVRVVFDNFAELFSGKIVFAHAICSLKAIVREVTQGVCRPFALRQYNMVLQ